MQKLRVGGPAFAPCQGKLLCHQCDTRPDQALSPLRIKFRNRLLGYFGRPGGRVRSGNLSRTAGSISSRHEDSPSSPPLSCVSFLAPAVPALAQKAVLVVRHGEKFSDTDERLTEAGKARAELLAKMLKDSGITAIFSTDTERTRGTVQPLAAALKQQVRIYDHPAALIQTLHRDHAHDVVLVAGHSNSIPVILKLLGCPEEVTIAPQEYDNVFVVVPKADGTATLVRLRY